jgi:hypothetical protein
MAHNHLMPGEAALDERQKTSPQTGVGWVMVLLVVLVASLGFTLDHILPIAP